MKLKYFKRSEFDCPCCGGNFMNEQLLSMLDAAREIAGVPFVVTSGYRCWGHHKEIYRKLGKPVLRNSPHLGGYGADISVPEGESRFRIIEGLLKAGFRRLGIGKDFVHVDVMPGKVEPRVWVY